MSSETKPQKEARRIKKGRWKGRKKSAIAEPEQ
jgi:hypothetical protein